MSLSDLPYKIPFGNGVQLLKIHPVGLVALHKPEGLLSTPNNEKDLNKTLIRAKFSKKKEAYVWFDEDKQQRFLYVCHRLDSHTSGVLLCSITENAAIEARRLFKEKKIQKEYYAVTTGHPKGKSGTWKDSLKNSRDRNQLRTKASKTGDFSSASWTLLNKRNSPFISLLSLKPHTGRTHQLRVQTSIRNMGIIGDRTYGDFKANTRMRKEFGVKRLCLHSYQISFDCQDFIGQKIKFHAKSPVPVIFNRLFEKSKT